MNLSFSRFRLTRTHRSRVLASLAGVGCLLIASGVAYAFAVYGAIGDKYKALGGPGGALGQPLSDEADAPHGGRFNNFQSGMIYWHPSIGAFGVWGLIGAKWNDYRRVEYGYPITDETRTPDGVGRFNHFRAIHLPGKPESSIYWTPKTGAHAIYGAIRGKWAQLGWERSLGYPTTDELTTPDGVGRFNHFRRLDNGAEASIYWTPQTGPVEIYGAIRQKWAQMGWERSSLGYPTNPEYQEYQGSPIRRQLFQRGSLWWSPSTGVRTEPIATGSSPSQPSNPGQPSTPSNPGGNPPPPQQAEARYCTDDCQACARDGLRCGLVNKCSFQNYRTPWGCY